METTTTREPEKILDDIIATCNKNNVAMGLPLIGDGNDKQTKPNAPTFHWLSLVFAVWATIATLFAAYLYIHA